MPSMRTSLFLSYCFYICLRDNRIQLCNEFVYVNAVSCGCFLKRLLMSERAVQAMHTAFHKHFGELIGIALLKNVDDKHIF